MKKTYQATHRGQVFQTKTSETVTHALILERSGSLEVMWCESFECAMKAGSAHRRIAVAAIPAVEVK